jgi:nitrogen PTS system EIIA component
MHIEDLLSASDVVVDFAARDKADLLRAPAARATSVFKLSSDAVADTMQRRDELGSTGIGNGVSTPQARPRELKKPFGLLVRLKLPLDYQVIDSEPVHIVLCWCYPPFASSSNSLRLRSSPASFVPKACLNAFAAPPMWMSSIVPSRYRSARRRANQLRQRQVAAAAPMRRARPAVGAPLLALILRGSDVFSFLRSTPWSQVCHRWHAFESSLGGRLAAVAADAGSARCGGVLDAKAANCCSAARGPSRH